jgi:plastocyanin
MRRIPIVFVLMTLLPAICGCIQPAGQTPVATPVSQETQSTTVPATTVPSVSANTILIQNFTFDPASITINAGDTVRWVNKDHVVHTVVFSKDSGLASSAPLSWNQGFSVKIFTPGVYTYSCSIHPYMQGTVVVT